MEIKRIKLKALEHFIESEEFKSLENQPLSRLRALSYLQNPRADMDDTILYLAYKNNYLAGYRSILPDILYGNSGPVKVGWLSGNWVLPELRRQGIASRLLEEAYKDWQGRLLFTNYAPESKAVYDKSEKFIIYKQYIGLRYYFRSSIYDLLKKRSTLVNKMKYLFIFLDAVVNFFQNLRLHIYNSRNKDSLPAFEYITAPDAEVNKIMETMQKNELENRSGNDHKWILDFPWITSAPLQDRNSGKYHFSVFSRQYNNFCLKIYQDHKCKGYIHMVRKDDFLSVPYFYTTSDELVIEAARLINLMAVALKVSVATVYQPLLLRALKSIKSPALGKKVIVRNYMVSRELKTDLPQESTVAFQDGDGDVVFTG